MAESAILRPTQHSPQSLHTLADSLELEHFGDDVDISGVALNASAVLPGDIFIALQGAHRHGIEFWPQAKAAGASAVMTDPAGRDTLAGEDVSVLVAAAPRRLLGALASKVYGTSRDGGPVVFSVTGTNGKTSTVFLLEAMMRALGLGTALSTTAVRKVLDVSYPSTLTTPEAPDIHAMLALASEGGVWGVALEVSAQALNKKRLEGVFSTVSGFTNLSHDHFEDFGNMDHYLAAKAALFTPEMTGSAVVCVDTPWGEKLAAALEVPLLTVAQAGHESALWHYELTKAEGNRSWWNLTGPDGEALSMSAPILGGHMVANAALASVMLVSSGVSASDLGAAMGPGTVGIPVYIPGRVENISSPGAPGVFLDAGRSADAYEQTLSTVRNQTKGRVVIVCGTSGNRDASKRPVMGQVAATLADVVIVTDDDPRLEDPHQIRAGLLEGARSIEGATVHEIADPTEAIRFALSLVGKDDSVLWCGPGSQAYRDIAGVKVPYSARQQALEALHLSGWPIDKQT